MILTIFIIIIIVYILLLIFRRWLSKRKIRKLFFGASIGIFGSMGTGKDLLQFIASDSLYTGKNKVWSNIGYKFKGDNYSWILKKEYLNFNNPNYKFPFNERDVISISEAGLYFPSEDYKKLELNLLGGAYLVKLIRHLFNGTFIINEQSPDRVWKQIREKLHYFVKIEKFRKGMFSLKFRVNFYDVKEDYGLHIFSKREIQKKGIQVTYKGDPKCFKLIFSKRYFKGYNTRYFSFLKDYKVQIQKDIENKRGYCFINDNEEQFNDIDSSYDILRKVGIDKVDELLKGDSSV